MFQIQINTKDGWSVASSVAGYKAEFLSLVWAQLKFAGCANDNDIPSMYRILDLDTLTVYPVAEETKEDPVCVTERRKDAAMRVKFQEIYRTVSRPGDTPAYTAGIQAGIRAAIRYDVQRELNRAANMTVDNIQEAMRLQWGGVKNEGENFYRE